MDKKPLVEIKVARKPKDVPNSPTADNEDVKMDEGVEEEELPPHSSDPMWGLSWED